MWTGLSDLLLTADFDKSDRIPLLRFHFRRPWLPSWNSLTLSCLLTLMTPVAMWAVLCRGWHSKELKAASGLQPEELRLSVQQPLGIDSATSHVNDPGSRTCSNLTLRDYGPANNLTAALWETLSQGAKPSCAQTPDPQKSCNNKCLF